MKKNRIQRLTKPQATAQSANDIQQKIIKTCRAIVCQHCGREEAAGERLKICSRCENAHYCGPECQRAAWPGHKAECRQRQELNARVKAAGAGDHLEQYNLWVQESRGLLSRLLFGELGPDILTHALIVRVEHNHTQTPPFKVIQQMPVPFTQLASSCEDLWELIRQHQDKLKLQPPKDPYVGYVIVMCGPLPGRVIPFSLEKMPTKKSKEINAGTVKLINAGAETALQSMTLAGLMGHKV